LYGLPILIIVSQSVNEVLEYLVKEISELYSEEGVGCQEVSGESPVSLDQFHSVNEAFHCYPLSHCEELQCFDVSGDLLFEIC
jgi:hypothetical protein